MTARGYRAAKKQLPSQVCEVEWKTLCRARWWNTTRLHSKLGYRTPQETDNHYWHTHHVNTPNLQVTTQERNP